MLLTEQLKSQILEAVIDDFDRKKSKDSRQNKVRHAHHLGINPSIYSRLMNGETDRILSEGEWLRIGMELNVNLNGLDWKLAKTATTSTIWAQLDYCRKNSLSAIFCDDKGIGKSYTGRQFELVYPNVAFVDCSKNYTRGDLLRAIARRFGFDYRGKLSEVKANIINNVLTLDKPLLILDEAGDLSYSAFLEIKSLWNSMEYMCGFYMMGANGLKAKIDRQIRNYKVGYEEIFDRFGDRYQYMTKDLGQSEKAAFKRHQAQTILRTQLPKLSAKSEKEILNNSGLNLRRLQIEIVKYLNRQ